MKKALNIIAGFGLGIAGGLAIKAAITEINKKSLKGIDEKIEVNELNIKNIREDIDELLECQKKTDEALDRITDMIMNNIIPIIENGPLDLQDINEVDLQDVSKEYKDDKAQSQVKQQSKVKGTLTENKENLENLEQINILKEKQELEEKKLKLEEQEKAMIERYTNKLGSKQSIKEVIDLLDQQGDYFSNLEKLGTLENEEEKEALRKVINEQAKLIQLNVKKKVGDSEEK